MNTPVNFEIAKLLKEKGLHLKVRSMYCEGKLLKDTNSKGNYNDVIWVRTWRNSPTDDTVSAPTIAEVVMWLYDKHNYSIEHSMNIPQSGEQDGCYVFNGIVKGAENYKLVIHYSSENLSSIEKAYEVAIEYTLKNLI